MALLRAPANTRDGDSRQNKETADQLDTNGIFTAGGYQFRAGCLLFFYTCHFSQRFFVLSPALSTWSFSFPVSVLLLLLSVLRNCLQVRDYIGLCVQLWHWDGTKRGIVEAKRRNSYFGGYIGTGGIVGTNTTENNTALAS